MAETDPIIECVLDRAEEFLGTRIINARVEPTGSEWRVEALAFRGGRYPWKLVVVYVPYEECEG